MKLKCLTMIALLALCLVGSFSRVYAQDVDYDPAVFEADAGSVPVSVKTDLETMADSSGFDSSAAMLDALKRDEAATVAQIATRDPRFLDVVDEAETADRAGTPFSAQSAEDRVMQHLRFLQEQTESYRQLGLAKQHVEWLLNQEDSSPLEKYRLESFKSEINELRRGFDQPNGNIMAQNELVMRARTVVEAVERARKDYMRKSDMLSYLNYGVDALPDRARAVIASGREKLVGSPGNADIVAKDMMAESERLAAQGYYAAAVTMQEKAMDVVRYGLSSRGVTIDIRFELFQRLLDIHENLDAMYSARLSRLSVELTERAGGSMESQVRQQIEATEQKMRANQVEWRIALQPVDRLPTPDEYLDMLATTRSAVSKAEESFQRSKAAAIQSQQAADAELKAAEQQLRASEAALEKQEAARQQYWKRKLQELEADHAHRVRAKQGPAKQAPVQPSEYHPHSINTGFLPLIRSGMPQTFPS